MSSDAGAPEELAAANVVPRRLVTRDAPGLAGTDYWDLYEMWQEMEGRDPKMRYDSLRIIGDEIWNFVDGKRSVNQIARAIGAEFDFDLESRHVLRLFQGLEKEGSYLWTVPVRKRHPHPRIKYGAGSNLPHQGERD